MKTLNTKIKKEKQLKKIAEKHYYRKVPLTLMEFNLLKSSKYSNIIDENNIKTFDTILEKSFKKDEDFIQRPNLNIKKSNLYAGLDKFAIEDLVDEIEIEFDLGVNNKSPFKFRSIDVQDIKAFIIKYIRFNVTNKYTKQFLENIINDDNTSTTNIMFRLYHSIEH
jgi:hypothetical protein